MSLFQVLLLSFLIHLETFGSSLLSHKFNENSSAANSKRCRNLCEHVCFPMGYETSQSIPKHPLGRRKTKTRSFTS